MLVLQLFFKLVYQCWTVFVVVVVVVVVVVIVTEAFAHYTNSLIHESIHGEVATDSMCLSEARGDAAVVLGRFGYLQIKL